MFQPFGFRFFPVQFFVVAVVFQVAEYSVVSLISNKDFFLFLFRYLNVGKDSSVESVSAQRSDGAIGKNFMLSIICHFVPSE